MMSAKLNLIYFLIILSLVLFGCSHNETITSVWSENARGEDAVFMVENELILKNNNRSFKVNKITGEKEIWPGVTNWHSRKNLRISKLGEKAVVFTHLHEGITYALIEKYHGGWNDCMDKMYSYFIEKKDRNRTTGYLLGSSKRFEIADFEWIDHNLFIIKNSSKGGDAYFLEKYVF